MFWKQSAGGVAADSNQRAHSVIKDVITLVASPRCYKWSRSEMAKQQIISSFIVQLLVYISSISIPYSCSGGDHCSVTYLHHAGCTITGGFPPSRTKPCSAQVYFLTFIYTSMSRPCLVLCQQSANLGFRLSPAMLETRYLTNAVEFYYM